MGRSPSDTDDWEQDSDEPDEEDDPTAPCPLCRRDIYDDAVQCPYCGTYISISTGVWADKPAWLRYFAVVAVLAVIAVLLWPILVFVLGVLSRAG